MLPQSHISYTIAAFELLKERLSKTTDLQQVDYRLLALAATGPDLIDKPFAAAYFYRKQGSAVLFAHTLLIHLLLFLYTWWKKPAWWPYALAFNGHAILDRLWFFKQTWYWPFTGWRFHRWQKAGSEQPDIKLAYWYAFTRRPELWGWEVGGVLLGGWFVLKHRLYRPARAWHLVRTGHLPD